MKCLTCAHPTRVLETRETRGCLRRTRVCTGCGDKTTTYETVGEPLAAKAERRRAERDTEVRELIKLGVKQDFAADVLGVSQATVSNIMKAANA